MHTGTVAIYRMHTGIGRMHTGIHTTWTTVCVRWFMKSPYAYGNNQNHCTHTGIHNLSIPVCIRVSRQSPYAYGDFIKHRMHTEIQDILTPVCVRGFYVSPYAYGVCSVTNRMHNEFVPIWENKTGIPICEISHMGIAVRIWGSPYAYGRGSLKIRIWSLTVRITNLCAYGD